MHNETQPRFVNHLSTLNTQSWVMFRRPLSCMLIALALTASPAAHAEGKGKQAKQPYLQLDTIAASVMRPSGRHGVLTVEVGLDASDPKLRDRLELYQPMLRSAYVSAIQPYALGIPPGAPPNADYIASVLQRETDRVLGQSGARVLVGSILIN